MKNTNEILKFLRNGLLLVASLIIIGAVVLGPLMTNAEIKYMAYLAGQFVCGSITFFILQIFVVFFHKEKRGVTFYK